MKELTVEEMLQIGYDCGLNHIEEAYGQIMSHYDAFFYIPELDKQLESFKDKIIAAGLVDENKTLLDLTIKEAAEKIKYSLTEVDWDALPKLDEEFVQCLTSFSQATGI